MKLTTSPTLSEKREVLERVFWLLPIKLTSGRPPWCNFQDGTSPRSIRSPSRQRGPRLLRKSVLMPEGRAEPRGVEAHAKKARSSARSRQLWPSTSAAAISRGRGCSPASGQAANHQWTKDRSMSESGQTVPISLPVQCRLSLPIARNLPFRFRPNLAVRGGSWGRPTWGDADPCSGADRVNSPS
jgi:hypothetical protein